MASQQHKVPAQNAELRCSGLARVKSVHSEIRQSWVFGLQMPSFFIKTVQSGHLCKISSHKLSDISNAFARRLIFFGLVSWFVLISLWCQYRQLYFSALPTRPPLLLTSAPHHARDSNFPPPKCAMPTLQSLPRSTISLGCHEDLTCVSNILLLSLFE